MNRNTASEGMMVGTKMRKLNGYSFNGEVRAAFTNKAGDLRYVCELDGENGAGMLHIFSPQQIGARPPHPSERSRRCLRG